MRKNSFLIFNFYTQSNHNMKSKSGDLDDEASQIHDISRRKAICDLTQTKGRFTNKLIYRKIADKTRLQRDV